MKLFCVSARTDEWDGYVSTTYEFQVNKRGGMSSLEVAAPSRKGKKKAKFVQHANCQVTTKEQDLFSVGEKYSLSEIEALIG